jgi:hypothetical protein
VHDPMTVAHEIPRPWPSRSGMPAAAADVRWRVRLHHEHGPWCEPGCAGNPFPWWRARSYSRFWRLAGRDFYWPPLVTIWHVEPGGRDGLSVCSRRYQDRHGDWHFTRGWRWHVHHWHVQLHPVQELRRWALTRCEWCGGRSVKGDLVNHSLSWDLPGSPWWRGERGLFHADCTELASADAACLCDEPAPEQGRDYGRCLRCGKFRAWNVPAERLARQRELVAHPPRARAARRALPGH